MSFPFQPLLGRARVQASHQLVYHPWNLRVALAVCHPTLTSKRESQSNGRPVCRKRAQQRVRKKATSNQRKRLWHSLVWWSGATRASASNPNVGRDCLCGHRAMHLTSCCEKRQLRNGKDTIANSIKKKKNMFFSWRMVKKRYSCLVHQRSSFPWKGIKRKPERTSSGSLYTCVLRISDCQNVGWRVDLRHAKRLNQKRSAGDWTAMRIPLKSQVDWNKTVMLIRMPWIMKLQKHWRKFEWWNSGKSVEGRWPQWSYICHTSTSESSPWDRTVLHRPEKRSFTGTIVESGKITKFSWESMQGEVPWRRWNWYWCPSTMCRMETSEWQVKL